MTAVWITLVLAFAMLRTWASPGRVRPAIPGYPVCRTRDRPVVLTFADHAGPDFGILTGSRRSCPGVNLTFVAECTQSGVHFAIISLSVAGIPVLCD